MKEIEIYFSDLKEEKQKEILKAENLSCPEDANWDVFPIATYFVEDEEE